MSDEWLTDRVVGTSIAFISQAIAVVGEACAMEADPDGLIPGTRTLFVSVRAPWARATSLIVGMIRVFGSARAARARVYGLLVGTIRVVASAGAARARTTRAVASTIIVVGSAILSVG